MLLLLFATGVIAQPEPVERHFQNLFTEWEVTLDQAQAELSRSETISADQLTDLRTSIENLEEAAGDLNAELGAEIQEVRGLLDALGPSPGLMEPSEEEAVAARRRGLENQLALLQGREKHAELTAVRARILIDKFAESIRAKIADTLFARGPSPFSIHVWASGGRQLLAVLHQLIEAPFETLMPALSTPAGRSDALATLVALLLAVALGWPLSRGLLRRFGRDPALECPSFARRLRAAVAVGVARGLVPSLGVLAVLATAYSRAPPQIGFVGHLVGSALLGFIFVVMVLALARASLAPSAPAWRLSPLTDRAAGSLFRRLVAITFVAAIDFAIRVPVSEHLEVPTEAVALYNLVVNIILALLVLSLLPARLWETVPTGEARPGSQEDKPKRYRAWPLLRLAVGLVVVTVPLAAALGYTNLATYLVHEVVLTGVVFGVLLIFHALARDTVKLFVGQDAEKPPVTGQTREAGDKSGRILYFWALAAFDLVLIAAGALVLLPTWGVAWSDIADWIERALVGIQIGSFTLSLPDLLLAIVVFVALLFVTRWVQRVLENRIFPQTRLDLGMRHSLKTATGYVGLLLAASMAIAGIGSR